MEITVDLTSIAVGVLAVHNIYWYLKAKPIIEAFEKMKKNEVKDDE